MRGGPYILPCQHLRQDVRLATSVTGPPAIKARTPDRRRRAPPTPHRSHTPGSARKVLLARAMPHTRSQPQDHPARVRPPLSWVTQWIRNPPRRHGRLMVSWVHHCVPQHDVRRHEGNGRLCQPRRNHCSHSRASATSRASRRPFLRDKTGIGIRRSSSPRRCPAPRWLWPPVPDARRDQTWPGLSSVEARSRCRVCQTCVLVAKAQHR